MKYCVRCGRRLYVNDQFCTGCGMSQPFVPPELLDCTAVEACPPMPEATTYALVPVYSEPFSARHKKGVLPYIVWSLILVPFFNIVGTPLAVVAAMLALAADAGSGSESTRKLGKAAVFCIIATAVDVITLIFFFLSTVILSRTGGF